MAKGALDAVKKENFGTLIGLAAHYYYNDKNKFLELTAKLKDYLATQNEGEEEIQLYESAKVSEFISETFEKREGDDEASEFLKVLSSTPEKYFDQSYSDLIEKNKNI